YALAHVPGQLIPAGLLVTVPCPWIETLSVNSAAPGVLVGVADAVAVAVAVGVRVGVSVFVGVMVAVGVGLLGGVSVGVAVGVAARLVKGAPQGTQVALFTVPVLPWPVLSAAKRALPSSNRQYPTSPASEPSSRTVRLALISWAVRATPHRRTSSITPL